MPVGPACAAVSAPRCRKKSTVAGAPTALVCYVLNSFAGGFSSEQNRRQPAIPLPKKATSFLDLDIAFFDDTFLRSTQPTTTYRLLFEPTPGNGDDLYTTCLENQYQPCPGVQMLAYAAVLVLRCPSRRRRPRPLNHWKACARGVLEMQIAESSMAPSRRPHETHRPAPAPILSEYQIVPDRFRSAKVP